MANVETKRADIKVISPIKFAHVVLRTRPENFAEMVNFYKTILGGRASHENDFLSFITYDDEHHRVAIAAMPNIGPKNNQTAGLEHIAFTFASVKDLLAAYRQRKQLGIEPVWCINHGVTLSIYYRDPDGNRVETQVDSFGSTEEATAYMRSADFKQNPIGVEFDPEGLIKKLESGESVQSLLKRPSIGRRGLAGSL